MSYVSMGENTFKQKTLFSINFSAVPNRFKYPQSACFKEIVYKMFSAVPNRFKYRQSASFTKIVYKMFSAVPNRFKYRESACFREIVFKIGCAVPKYHFKQRQNVQFDRQCFQNYQMGWFTTPPPPPRKKEGFRCKGVKYRSASKNETNPYLIILHVFEKNDTCVIITC